MRLLYFSPVNWHSYYQRPHYMVRYFLACHPDNKVLWVNPYPTRFPGLQDFSRLKFNLNSTATTIIDNLEIISPKALPIEPLAYSEKINYLLFWQKHWKKFENFCNTQNKNNTTIIGIGRPSKLALLALQTLSYTNSFYDAMDNFPEFYSGYSRLSMSKIEKEISGLTQKIFVSSSYLATKFYSGIKIFNGYDMTSLPPISNPLTKDSHQIIFGYIGTIGKWFDWPVVINLAQQFPDALIRLIGPQYVKYSGALPKNIELFPECPQSEAITYLNKFTVGLIPFKQNTLTQAIDPIKYYEYRAMGLPVISTRFGEMNTRNHQQGVYFFDECNQDKITEALSDKDNKNNIENINLFRKTNDWQSRFSLCGFSS
jgi:hypothetical protein